MSVQKTSIEGLLKIEFNKFNDNRGMAAKIFSTEWLKDLGIEFNINDLFYSISNKNVIRGMHFQTKPFEQEKLVCVTKGKIIDVVLDLRQDSKTFKKYEEFILSEYERKIIFIPKGCAHGFKSLEDNTMVFYAISGQYSKIHDTGIRWNSFGYNWGNEKFTFNERDKSLDKLIDIKLN